MHEAKILGGCSGTVMSAVLYSHLNARRKQMACLQTSHVPRWPRGKGRGRIKHPDYAHQQLGMRIASLESFGVMGSALNRGSMPQSDASEISGAESNHRTGKDTDLSTLYPPCWKSLLGPQACCPQLATERKTHKGEAETVTATCHAKTNQGPHAFANPWCKKGYPESQHNCSSSDCPRRTTDLTSLTETLPRQSPAQELIKNMDSLPATGLGTAVPCFGCLGQVRKKAEAEKSDPATFALF